MSEFKPEDKDDWSKKKERRSEAALVIAYVSTLLLKAREGMKEGIEGGMNKLFDLVYSLVNVCETVQRSLLIGLEFDFALSGGMVVNDYVDKREGII